MAQPHRPNSPCPQHGRRRSGPQAAGGLPPRPTDDETDLATAAGRAPQPHRPIDHGPFRTSPRHRRAVGLAVSRAAHAVAAPEAVVPRVWLASGQSLAPRARARSSEPDAAGTDPLAPTDRAHLPTRRGLTWPARERQGKPALCTFGTNTPAYGMPTRESPAPDCTGFLPRANRRRRYGCGSAQRASRASQPDRRSSTAARARETRSASVILRRR
jgi:hypothetical protein